MKTIRLAHYLLVFMVLWLPAAVSGAPVASSISSGMNLVAVTSPITAQYPSSFALLNAWKTAGITAIEGYDPDQGALLRAGLDSQGNPVGSDFQLHDNSALSLVSAASATLS